MEDLRVHPLSKISDIAEHIPDILFIFSLLKFLYFQLNIICVQILKTRTREKGAENQRVMILVIEESCL